jgi:hypothetical protein
MEVWDIADQYFQDHPSSSPEVVVVPDRRENRTEEKGADVENNKLRNFDLASKNEDSESLILRHSHNPKSTPRRILMGTAVLAFILFIVLKMLSMGWHRSSM